MSDAQRLLAWYDRHRRDLPWRRTRDPWAIWVSEILLQQTRVEAALPYYERFLARFPTPAALAAASEEELLATWSGLGYYGRARRLHEAARRLTSTGAGIPRTARELAEMPGVGPYTAAAVASIAFGETVPVVDGNVARVMARRLALAGDPGRAAFRRQVESAAAALLDSARAGDSNQALMELGATVCTARRPGCARCPLARGCRAAANGTTAEFPTPRRRRPPQRERWTALLVEDGAGRVLFHRRGERERVLAALWELPTVRGRGRSAAARALAERFGGRWRVDARRLVVRHAITFRALEIELRSAHWWPDGSGETEELVWRPRTNALGLPLTGATRKLLAALAGEP